MDERLPAWIGKSKESRCGSALHLDERPVMYFRSEKTRTWRGFGNIRDCRRREVEFETKR